MSVLIKPPHRDGRRPRFSRLGAGLLLMMGMIGVSAASAVHAQAQAARWRIGLMPASLNRNATLQLIAGHTQAVDLMLQAAPEVLAENGPYRINLALDMPAGMELVHAGGGFTVIGVEREGQEPPRSCVVLTLDVPQSRLAGDFNRGWVSEWRSQTLFFQVPEQLAPAEAYLHLRLSQGEQQVEQRWPIDLVSLPAATRRPELTTIGLWDYNHSRAGLKEISPQSSARASEGTARMLAAAGINFTQKGSNDYFQAARRHGIRVGGDIHQSAFYSRAHADIRLNGTQVEGDYPCAYSVAQLPAGTPIPGVRAMLEAARAYDGMATYDYEPRSHTGFSPASMGAFKAEYGIGDAQFDHFLNEFKKVRHRIYLTEDPELLETYRKWVRFRTDQNVAYVKRLYEEAKAVNPDIVIAMTPNSGYSDDAMETLGYGNNAAAAAPYVDIIMPQIYVGYGGAAVKFSADLVSKWHQSLQAQEVQTRLWPLLLVRYAGASVFNTPERVRQQAIGALASGAHGLLLYYPGMMDGTYWQMVARMTEEIATYEQFYHLGQRVEDHYPLSNMPQGSVQISRYPGHFSEVTDPQWQFFAHEYEERVLLTLMNLEADNDVLFNVSLPEGWDVSAQEGVEPLAEGQWLVRPADVGFVTLIRYR